MHKFIKHIAKTGKYFDFYISYQWRSGQIPNAEKSGESKIFLVLLFDSRKCSHHIACETILWLV